MTTVTQDAFFQAYRERLIQTDAHWATQEELLNSFMTKTIAKVRCANPRPGWSPTSKAAIAAWNDIGMDGTPSLVRLRALQQDVAK